MAKRESLTINELVTPNGNTVKFGAAAPTTGTYKVGDIVFNTTPVAGAAFAWSCSVAGTPGTWIEPPAMASVTATAAQLNFNAGVTAGTALASKTLVLDAAKAIGTITTLGATTVNAVNLNASTAATVTSASASSLAVGRLGATTPAFVVDSSTATQVAGLKVTGAATGGTVAVTAVDSGADAGLSIASKGTGVLALNKPVSTHTTTAAINATAVATAAEVATGYITSTSAAATAITLPTGTLLGAALGAVQGTVHDLYIDNTAGASTVTIVVAVNGILSALAAAEAGGSGLLTVPAGVTGQARFTLMFSSATAYTFTRTA